MKCKSRKSGIVWKKVIAIAKVRISEEKAQCNWNFMVVSIADCIDRNDPKY